jgi:hypothetical protein
VHSAPIATPLKNIVRAIDTDDNGFGSCKPGVVVVLYAVRAIQAKIKIGTLRELKLMLLE